MQLPLPVTTYRLSSPKASSARLRNCYAEPAPKDSPKGRAILRRSPGIKSWVTLNADGPVRGACVMAGVLYALAGSTVYSVSSQGVATALTGTVPGSERVRMSTNGTDLVIVRPFDGTAYETQGSTVAQIDDSTFTGWTAADVDFLDGYLVFRRPSTAQFFNSGLTATTFNALDIATAEARPDDLVGLIVDHRELFLLGEESCEIWYNAGNATGSPFSRNPSGLLEIGCAASYSPGRFDNSVGWLANDRTVRKLNQTNPQKISHFGVDAAIQRMATVDDAFALTYSQEGHIFYALTFPMAGRTFVYDASTGEWHERESLGYGRWRPNCIVQAYGKQIVGDSETGKLGILDPDTHEEWSEPQRVAWTYQPVYSEHNRASHIRFELVLNTGHGLTTGQGSDPLATLKVSDDSGETFRTLPTQSLGKIGEYQHRAQWWRLGSSRDRVYQVEITDPVPLFVVDTQLLVKGGRL